ncbi:MAG TPA: NAD(P)/FAD-dependent oxidoreductase [Steroidobacteraceae bacterium]|nr:NAD(P)/FAD-dependent oxidoreductase [Steroidobacteraceae bacterium]
MRNDVIVVGAGHNGLTSAAYLAAAGLKVLVLERREVVGGCAVTEEVDAELAPGCRVSTASYIASMLRPEVIRDLKLATYGLKMIACEPGVQAAFEDGDVVAWWNDAARLQRELERVAPRDVQRFFEVERELLRLASFLEPFFMEPPPNLDARGPGRIRELWRVFTRLRRANGTDIAGLMEFLTGSLGHFLDRRFASEKLKRLILANSVYGKHGGPYHAGTAMGLLFHLLTGGEAREPGFQGHVIGGMGAITEAMRRACVDRGVEIRTQAPVQRINQSGGRVRGVTLESGEALDAGIVVSNADPKRTFLGLLDASDLDDDFRARVRAIRMAGPCAKVNYVLAAEPRVIGMPADRDPQQRSFFTLVPTLAAAEDCYNRSQRGDIPAEPWIDCVVASNADPTLAPQGRHMLTCFVQYLPWQPRASSWDREREALGDRVTAIIGRYAPNVPASVIARRVLTPLDLERTFGITEGNIFHGDLALEQMFFMRPVPGWSRYRTPIDGLYLCGAGTHPGGGVTGAPGYNAAQMILKERTR